MSERQCTQRPFCSIGTSKRALCAQSTTRAKHIK
jgi:hypothetical protein